MPKQYLQYAYYNNEFDKIVQPYSCMSQKIITNEGFVTKPKNKFAMVHCSCCNRLVPGKIINWPGMSPEKKILWKPCKECGVWLSHAEEDNKSLKGKCFECTEVENK